MEANNSSRLNTILREKEHEFFGLVKEGQAASPPNILVKLKDGNQLAFGYHYLAKEMKYDPSQGIYLHFLDPDGTKLVHIQGSNLLPLWDALVWHRVSFIQEREYNPVATVSNDLSISSITISGMS